MYTKFTWLYGPVSGLLENPMDGGAWWAAVHGVAKSQTWLSDFTFTFHFHALEKQMATHSSVLAWRIPGTGEPGGLLSLGSHRVGHDWSDLAAAAYSSNGLLIQIWEQNYFNDWLVIFYLTLLVSPHLSFYSSEFFSVLLLTYFST